MVIWLVRESRDEHRQAIDWLNEHTDDSLAFFLIKVELWQIENSPYAVKFNIISQPNDWAKSVKSFISSEKITESKIKQLEFWNQFKVYAHEHNIKVHLGQKARPQHSFEVSSGSRHAHFDIALNSFEKEIRLELHIPDNKDLFYFLEDKKDFIEKELGKLEWNIEEKKKSSFIRIKRKGAVEETENWNEYFEWMQINLEKFYKVFSKLLKEYSK